MTPNPELRIGDAERDAAAASLREHYAQGRLTLDELNERLDASFAARTQGQLDKISADLPHSPNWGQAQQNIAPGPQQLPQRRNSIGTAAFVAGFVLVALVMLTLRDTHSGHSGLGILALIPALIILRVLFFRAFGRHRSWGEPHHHHHHGYGQDRRQSGQWSDQRWSSGPGRGSDDTW